VAFGVDRQLPLFNLTHEIPPYDIWAAAYRLLQTAPYCPAVTVWSNIDADKMQQAGFSIGDTLCVTWNATSRVANADSKAMRFVTSVDATIKKELHQLYMRNNGSESAAAQMEFSPCRSIPSLSTRKPSGMPFRRKNKNGKL
jgi:S-adenosylmethionine hydrolase